MNPHFSRSKVASRQGDIRQHVAKLCRRLSAFAASREPVNLGAAVTAFTRDVANDFIFHKHYGSLDRDDFDVATMLAGHGTGFMWRLGKQVKWFMPLLKSIPPRWLRPMAHENTQKFLDNLEVGTPDVAPGGRAVVKLTSGVG